MKRFLTLALALLFMLSLAACGENPSSPAGEDGGSQGTESPASGQPTEFENKLDLLLDKTHYEREERIEVTMDFADVDQGSSVIVTVASAMPHGEGTPAEETCEEYRWLADFSEIPFYLWAPDKDGVFDVRIYAGSEGGEELASASFTVGSAQLSQEAVPPTDPPKAIYMDVLEGGSTATGGTYSFALLDGNYSFTLNNDGVFFHTSAEMRTNYCPYDDGWRIDNSAYEYAQVPEEALVYEMTAYLDTFYEDAEAIGYANNIAKYYVGTETVCYRNCWVYEIKDDGYGAYKKFWIDPENGATLKYIEREGGDTTYEFEVTQYNLLGPVWNSTMRPDYSSVTETLY